MKPTVKVTVEVAGKVHRLSLIPQPWKGRYWIRYQGKASDKMPDSTISKLCEEIRKLIVKGEKSD